MRTTTLLLCLLAGCVSAPDRPELDPSVPLADGWTARSAAGAVSDGPWWSSFQDPGLEALIPEALAANQDLVAARHNVEFAAAQVAIQRAGRLPTLDLTAGSSRRRQNFIGFPIPGGGNVLSTTATVHSAGFGVAWEPDLWGRIAAGIDAAEAQRAAAVADLEGIAQSLAAQVTLAWFALREATQQRELAERTVASWGNSQQILRDRYEAGVRDALDLRLATAELRAAEANLATRLDVEQRARRTIEVLLGRYPSGELEASGPFPALPDPVPAGLPADLLSRRPDLLAARLRLEAARSLSEQARADLWPRLTLTGDAGRSSGELEDLLDGDFSTWGLALNLAQPIIDGGRRRATIEAQDAQAQVASEQLAGLTLRACLEVETSLASEARILTRVSALEAALEESVAAEALAEDQYGRGLLEIITVLEAQRRRFLAESALLESRRLLFENRVNLHLALGGGFGPSSETN